MDVALKKMFIGGLGCVRLTAELMILKVLSDINNPVILFFLNVKNAEVSRLMFWVYSMA